MKQEYTQYLTCIKKEYNQKIKGMNISFEEWINETVNDIINKFDNSNSENISKNLDIKSDIDIAMYQVLLAEYTYLFSKKVIQYFIPSIDLIDFMINSFKDNTNYNDLLNILIEDNGLVSSFIINFPIKSKFQSILIILSDKENKSKMISYSISRTKDIPETIGILSSNNFSTAVDNLHFPLCQIDEDKKLNNSTPYIKLLIGMCLYKRCFPQSVRDGLPNDCSHPNYYNNSKTINIVDEILESDGVRTITPHIRSGHLRLLKDDRYVNKKNQVIFIEACFVKGKSKTIENMDNRKLIIENTKGD